MKKKTELYKINFEGHELIKKSKLCWDLMDELGIDANCDDIEDDSLENISGYLRCIFDLKNYREGVSKQAMEQMDIPFEEILPYLYLVIS